MAVRPPQQGSDDPDTIEFGIAALVARLDDADVEFPATGEDVVTAVQNTDIPYDASSRTVALEAVLDDVSKDQFDSRSELLDALHPVFEEYRESASRNVLARLRAMLPI